MLELNGQDSRREPLEARKATLASVLAKAGSACGSMSTWSTTTGNLSSATACKLGLEGTVSKRLGLLPLWAVRSPDWLKMKNPNAPAVKRETEEDWGLGNQDALAEG